MGWYSVTDMQKRQAVWVYNLPSADFGALYAMLAKFSKEHNLEDAVLSVRKYGPGERNVEKAKAGKTDKKKKSAKKARHGLDADSGKSYVCTFGWTPCSLDDVKQIDYSFYDAGWPARIVISKMESAVSPTQITFSCCEKQYELAKAFHRILKDSPIGPEKPYTPQMAENTA